MSDKQDAADDGRVGRHWDAFEKGQFQGQVLDIDANKGLTEARAEEERRALMKKPKLPGEEFVYQVKASRCRVFHPTLMFMQPKGQVKGLASQRHQLTSLLSTAYSQREELEERIAANKKGMRAAGTKYGEWAFQWVAAMSLTRRSRILTYSLIPTQQCMHYFCTIYFIFYLLDTMGDCCQDICLYNYCFDSLSNSHPARSLMVLQTLFLTLATSATRSLASSNRSLYSLQSANSSEILSHASSTARH